MDERLRSLKEKLDQQEWPAVYMFKFIVPSDNHKIALVEALFGEEAIVDLRSSKNGKYTSISAKEMMLSTDHIIQKYEEASKIEGLIAL